MVIIMGKTCIGCGKAVGGMFGAFSNKVLYGDICITCTRKLSMIPGYQTLTPGQINSVVRGNVKPSEVMPAISYAHFGEAHAKKAPAKEQTPIEEVQRWKGLLDEGALSQEEFDAVKRLLLSSRV